MNRSYTKQQRQTAMRVYRRTRSVTRTVRELGYPSRHTMYKWIRESKTRGRKPKRKQAKRLSRYPWQAKMRAVELFGQGWRMQDIAAECGVLSPPVIYDWVRRYNEQGQWGLMSKKERVTQLGFTTKHALIKSLPDDPEVLKQQLAELMVDKALLEEEMKLIKKDERVIPTAMTNAEKTVVVDALAHRLPLSMLLAQAGLASSSFYYHRQQRNKPDKHADIRELLHVIDAEARNTYGYRRMWWALRHRGVVVSEKVVRRLMKQEGIIPRYPKKKWQYCSYQGEVSPAPDNLVNKNFHADKPNQLWLTDISMFPSDGGRVYLSAIVDCFDGKVVAAKTAVHPTMKLASDTLVEAVERECPVRDGSLIVHSDRGAHYRGRSWEGLMKRFGLTRSMSKKGYTPDNAACEGFFGRMKVEMFHGKKFKTTDELEQAIEEYIEFYNNKRIKTKFQGQTINQHRQLAVA